MTQLGNVLPRLVHALATKPEHHGPWAFMKLDIKDGFWRLIVPEEDEFNFCYVLPCQTSQQPIQIVVPSSLQMGWTSSPPYFCAATETARDVAEILRAQPSLPAHPLESITMKADEVLHFHELLHPSKWSLKELPDRLTNFNYLFEVFVDDFIAAIQCTHPAALLHHSRALLHAIHSIFPAAPHGTTNPDEEPISLVIPSKIQPRISLRKAQIPSPSESFLSEIGSSSGLVVPGGAAGKIEWIA